MKNKYALVTGIIAALTIYFFLALYILPQVYLSEPQVKPVPMLTNIDMPAESSAGRPFTISITGANEGDTADIQIISVAFPNITRIDGLVQIEHHDFTQTPRFVHLGDEVGSAYMGLERIVHAEYPSIEFFSRPWHAHVTHHIQIEVKPDTVGKFVVLVKTVALPHTSELAHYPREGFKDHQEEFVKVYSVDVKP